MNACVTMEDLWESGACYPGNCFTIAGSKISSETVFDPKQ